MNESIIALSQQIFPLLNSFDLGYNHHNGIEPDWRNACWGDNYMELNSLKEKYDPNHTFNCWHCVGYTGEEKESNTTIPSEAYALVNWNKITFSIISLVVTLQFLF